MGRVDEHFVGHCKSREGPACRSLRAAIGDGERRAARLSVKETDRNSESGNERAATGRRDVRYWNAAVPIRSNLLRLEHELQTVVDGSIWRRRNLRRVLTVSATPAPAALCCRHMRRSGKLRLPCSLRASGSLIVRIGRPLMAPQRIECAVRLRSSLSGDPRGGRAGCPDGTQPEHLPSASLLKAADAELASRL